MKFFFLVLILTSSLCAMGYGSSSDGCGKYVADADLTTKPEFFPISKLPSTYQNPEHILQPMTDEVPLTAETILEAYSKGLYPFTDLGPTAIWSVFRNRGILNFSELHISSSFKKAIRKGRFQITFDHAFADVIRACAEVPRPLNGKSWIKEKHIKTFIELHRMGHAHSVEVWLDGNLVGGLYGTHIKGVFSGESMFYKVPNASKFALLGLVDHLKSRGIEWLDAQQVSRVFAQFGAKYVPHREYLERLAKAHARSISFYPRSPM